MAPRGDISGFYDSLPRLSDFDALTRADSYTPLPQDWVIGAADIEGSTQAIARGQYKTVNMVGAAVISAQINGADGRDFPFVFGGDGAAFAVPPEMAETSAQALAAVQRWAAEEFGLVLRTAQVPVAEVRAAGREVAVARYQVSEDVDYGMFSGGGITWVEAQMKAGAYALPPAPPGTQPDLTGLSCRWANVQAEHGVILSLVIEPVVEVTSADFARLAERVIDIAHALDREGHPVPRSGMKTRWPPPGLDNEAHATRKGRALAWRRLQLLFNTFIAWFFFATGLPLGQFRPEAYRQQVTRNADYRKFDDGLKMTLDSDAATEARLRAELDAAQQAGIIRYGLYRQDEAMMTCIVPSVMQGNHVHFIDGAAGGYAQAAAQIKAAPAT